MNKVNPASKTSFYRRSLSETEDLYVVSAIVNTYQWTKFGSQQIRDEFMLSSPDKHFALHKMSGFDGDSEALELDRYKGMLENQYRWILGDKPRVVLNTFRKNEKAARILHGMKEGMRHDSSAKSYDDQVCVDRMLLVLIETSAHVRVERELRKHLLDLLIEHMNVLRSGGKGLYRCGYEDAEYLREVVEQVYTY